MLNQSNKPWGLKAGLIVALGVMGVGCSMRPTTGTQWATRSVTVITSAPAPMPAATEDPLAKRPDPPPAPAPVPEPVGDGVVVAQSIQDACGLTSEDMMDAKFALGSTKLSSGGLALLERIAACVKDGKLDDKKLELVGYTDPRGSEDFNMKLGRGRADAAKAVLLSSGVAGDRLRAESMGESAATGTDEASWAIDRRVEVRLQE